MTILDVAGGCLLHLRVDSNFVSEGTLDTIDKSSSARLHGRCELFRELRHKTVCWWQTSRPMCEESEGVQHYLWSSDSRPAYR